MNGKVEETGRARNAVLKLEADINTLSKRTAKLDLERMETDLKDVEEANAEAKARLPKLRLQT